MTWVGARTCSDEMPQKKQKKVVNRVVESTATDLRAAITQLALGASFAALTVCESCGDALKDRSLKNRLKKLF